MNNGVNAKCATVAVLATIAAVMLCDALASAASADASADSVMLRKPAARTSGSFLDEMSKNAEAAAVQDAEAKPVAEPVVQQKKASPQEAAVALDKDAPKPVEKVDSEEPKQEVVVPVVKKAAEAVAEKVPADKNDKKEKSAAKQPERDAIITADRTDYDRKEGVVLFDRNVHVDDTQYQMHADRLFLFLEGTNDLKRLVAIGHVAITNEDKRAYCARATFNKKLGRVVMYSSDEITAELCEDGKKGSNVKGEKITFWLDSEQVEVENPIITMPGGIGGQDSVKKLIGK